MASLRRLKNDIDYLASEVISDCYVALYFHKDEAKYKEVIAIIEEAVAQRNTLYERANNPVEKNNPSLVKKHYAALRRDMMSGVDGLFEQLSKLCK